jgi:outer membrane protein TolC
MMSSTIELSKAKFEVAQAEAVIADAEAKAARARLNVAKARLEYLLTMQEHGGSPQPSPHGSPRDAGALESSPVPKFVD